MAEFAILIANLDNGTVAELSSREEAHHARHACGGTARPARHRERVARGRKCLCGISALRRDHPLLLLLEDHGRLAMRTVERPLLKRRRASGATCSGRRRAALRGRRRTGCCSPPTRSALGPSRRAALPATSCSTIGDRYRTLPSRSSISFAVAGCGFAWLPPRCAAEAPSSARSS